MKVNWRGSVLFSYGASSLNFRANIGETSETDTLFFRILLECKKMQKIYVCLSSRDLSKMCFTAKIAALVIISIEDVEYYLKWPLTGRVEGKISIFNNSY